MLRDYEILYIVRPELDEEQLGQAMDGVQRLIQNLGGEPQKTDVWGRRRLAYEVDHLREGQYVLTDFRLDPERVTEMENTLKISETVFRHLITRKPEKVKRAAARPAAAAPAPAEPVTAPAAVAPEAEPVPAGQIAEAAPASQAAAPEEQEENDG